ncbi:PLP-dependent aminotransferase family protein [Pelagicoccus sp. SDUM812002]|uniref:aminotransferase-like domain-containing protein n=1 Tax=Pelagicoccus sp. SDUM812002 TaxID=3041266 RepID=UPI0028108F13|nr:PLP-dependent aminotransferase family protein [Pelagicoccus sp. SDUM812002]MDQ8185232.1 PLP-dependent aminotransferase family protein [Pelagicoccus sp. SDUM812002]
MSLKFSQLGTRQTESDIARLMTAALQRPELLSLAAGFTDDRTLPLAELTEVAVSLCEEGDRSVLQYGANQGSQKLRKLMTGRLEAQDHAGWSYDLECSFISNGSQQALYLAVQTLCDPGDIVLVEQPTYFVFLEMLRGLGVEAISMPMLRNGDVDKAGLSNVLEAYAAAGNLDRVKAVYLVSYYANPSGHSVSRECKSSLLALLGKFDGTIALFEDAAYRELFYAKPFEAESSLALAGEGNDVPIFYSTTLTKPFATGLKVGFGYCTHGDWLDRMMAVKGQQDFGTANYNQALLAKSLETGLFDRHLGVLRKSYLEKIETLHIHLADTLLAQGWSWTLPEGGLYLWLMAPGDMETGFDSELHQAAIEAGVLYVPGELCNAGRSPRNWARLSFGVLGLEDLKKAADRFCFAVKHTTAMKIS